MKNTLVIRINKKGIQSTIYIDNEKASPQDLLRVLKERQIQVFTFTTWEENEKKLEGHIMVENQRNMGKIIKRISKAQIK